VGDVAEKAGDVAGRVADEGKEIAGRVAEEAGELGQKGKEMAGEAVDRVRGGDRDEPEGGSAESGSSGGATS
jgi:hypothetical protein